MDSWFRHNGEVGEPAFLDEAQRKKMEQELRATFYTGYGKNALILNLTNLCFFRETITEEEVCLCNMAKRQLSQMGIWVEGNEEAIVDALLKVASPLSDKGEEE